MRVYVPKSGWYLLVFLIASSWICDVQAGGQSVESRGGSDFLWFDLQGCSRQGFSILPDYDKNAAIINSRLAAMHRNGQRSIRIAIAPPAGDKALQDYKLNVADFLDAIRKNGFSEIEIVISTVGDPPFKWHEWHENLYMRHLQTIIEMRPSFLASGLKYYIDLLNEGIPADNQLILLQFTQRLWADYTKLYGKTDTVGFSIITTVAQDRFKQIPRVYGDNPPNVFDLHIYDDSYRSFVNANERLKMLGYSNIPWIIGEAFFNDGEEADDIVRAISVTRQRVLFLLQWPLRRIRACDSVDVVPLDFGEYLKRGF